MIWLLGLLILCLIGAIIFIARLSAQINTQMNSSEQRLNNQMNSIFGILNERIDKNTHNLGETLDNKLNNLNSVIGKVQLNLGGMMEVQRQLDIKLKDISALQDLLRAPKFRGEVGETLLGNLLAQILPEENFMLQHRFKTGDSVDAAIKLGQNILPIDAKFPLENFRRMNETDNEADMNSFRKAFIRDVKNRIDEISKKYILPDEGTFDFAFMYIPAESVYSEITKEPDLTSYAKTKKVISVSPNTFYAYLQAICYGLHGLKIERNIQVVIANLSRLGQDLDRFKDDFRVLGSHLKNASDKFGDAQTRLDKFSDKLSTVQDLKAIEQKNIE
ncbi:MAG: DNA recombination protein RmuC [Candidatus Omnitrophota bacterium]